MSAGNPYHSFFYPTHQNHSNGYVETEHTYIIDSYLTNSFSWNQLMIKLKKSGIHANIDLNLDGDSHSKYHGGFVLISNDFLKVVITEDQLNRAVIGLIPALDYEEFHDLIHYDLQVNLSVDAINSNYHTYLEKYCLQATMYIQAVHRLLTGKQLLLVTVGSYMAHKVPSYHKDLDITSIAELNFSANKLGRFYTSKKQLV